MNQTMVFYDIVVQRFYYIGHLTFLRLVLGKLQSSLFSPSCLIRNGFPHLDVFI